MERLTPLGLPISPLRRFYVKDAFILQIENGNAWVEAETAVIAAGMAFTLWKPWFTGFSHEAWIDPQTGEEQVYYYSIEGALEHLETSLKEKKKKEKEKGKK